MARVQDTGSADALQVCPSLADMQAALELVDLQPLLAALGPPSGQRRGRAAWLPIVHAYFISRYPGLPVSRRLSRLYARISNREDPLREFCGFSSPESVPDRSTFSRVFKRLAEQKELVDQVFRQLSDLFGRRPWSQSSQQGRGGGSGAHRGSCEYYQALRRERRYGLYRFLEDFKADEDVERFFVENRWPDGIRCPRCGSDNIADRPTRKPQPWRCRRCRYDFSVKVGTVMQCSNLSLRQWLTAMYLEACGPKGESAYVIADFLEIDQGTALFLLHRIREAFVVELERFKGPVQADETYIGGVNKNKHFAKKLVSGRGIAGKAAIVGLLDMDSGLLYAQPLREVTTATVREMVRGRLEHGATLYTDQSSVYSEIPGTFRESVNHGRGEYVRDGVTTNAVESVWALLDRMLMGTYHQVSWKHLVRYVAELVWRHKTRPLKVLDRMASIAGNMAGRRLSLRELRQGGRASLGTIKSVLRPSSAQLELWPAWVWD